MSINIITPLEAALNYLRGGFSIIPLRCDGSKAPAISGWNPYRERFPTEEEIVQWWNTPAFGVGIVCGAISGNLWVIDIDDEATGHKFCCALKQCWPDFDQHVCIVRTPRPGMQLICRLNSPPPGNAVLARVFESAGESSPSTKTLIETRGEGGYIVGVGSPTGVHRTGRLYEKIAGPELTTLLPITHSQYEKLITAAQLFNEVEYETTDFVSSPYEGPPRPGDVFNNLADWNSLLDQCGWALTREDDGVSYWRRPGKADGISAQLGYFADATGAPRLSVFSTTAKCGPKQTSSVKVVDKFSFLAFEKFNGDFSQAALEASNAFSEQLDAAQREYWQGEEQTKPTDADGYSLVSKPASESNEKPVDWIWQGFIPLGMVTQYSGEPGATKSLFATYIAAIVSTGRDWPDGSRNLLGPSSVLMLIGEDEFDQVVLPRLIANGADLDHIRPIDLFLTRGDSLDVKTLSLVEHRPLLLHEMKSFERRGLPPCRLIIIDPLSCFLNGADENASSDMRTLTGFIRNLSKEQNCGAFIVHHFGKNANRDAKQRSMGSTALVAAARVFLGAFQDRSNPNRKVIAVCKSNIGPDRRAIAYEPVYENEYSQRTTLEWENQTFEFNENDFRDDRAEDDGRDELVEILEGLTYPIPVEEVYAATHAVGFSKPKTRRVAKSLGLVPKAAGFGEQWQFVRVGPDKRPKGNSLESPAPDNPPESTGAVETGKTDKTGKSPTPTEDDSSGAAGQAVEGPTAVCSDSSVATPLNNSNELDTDSDIRTSLRGESPSNGQTEGTQR